MSQKYTAAQISVHNKDNDLWLVLNNKVYDVTKYVDEHPGGLDTLMDVAGQEGTEAFNSVGHSDEAKEQLKKYLIGELADGETFSGSSNKPSSSSTSYASFAIIAALLAVCGYFIFFA